MNTLQIIATIFMVLPIIIGTIIQFLGYATKIFIPRKWTIISLIFTFFWIIGIIIYVIGTI